MEITCLCLGSAKIKWVLCYQTFNRWLSFYPLKARLKSLLKVGGRGQRTSKVGASPIRLMWVYFSSVLGAMQHSDLCVLFKQD